MEVSIALAERQEEMRAIYWCLVDEVRQVIAPKMDRDAFLSEQCICMDIEVTTTVMRYSDKEQLDSLRSCFNEFAGRVWEGGVWDHEATAVLMIYAADNDAEFQGRSFKAIVVFNRPVERPDWLSGNFDPPNANEPLAWLARTKPLKVDPQVLVEQWVHAAGDHLLEDGSLALGVFPAKAAEDWDAFQDYLAAQASLLEDPPEILAASPQSEEAEGAGA